MLFAHISGSVAHCLDLSDAHACRHTPIPWAAMFPQFLEAYAVIRGQTVLEHVRSADDRPHTGQTARILHIPVGSLLCPELKRKWIPNSV